MAKNRKVSGTIAPKKSKSFPINGKKQKQIKPKPTPPPPAQRQRQNKTAELSRQKRESEKAEKERRIMQFKQKRLEKTKVISMKTSRGQPLMKNRIEYLLKQIQDMKKH